MKAELRTLRQFIRFLWERKLWWLTPIVLVLFFLGLVIVLTESSAVAPFIYTLF